MADQSSETQTLQAQPNANLSDDEPDIHVCGKCKESFIDLTVYIEHKKAKLCQRSREKGHSIVLSTPDHDHSTQNSEFQVSPTQDESVVSDLIAKIETKTVVLTTDDSMGGDACTNKVVVELLDPVDVHTVITSQDVSTQEEQDAEQEQTSAATPKRRHKRKNSTPKTTRKSKSKSAPLQEEANQSTEEGDEGTVTVHIPESQLVHLGGEPGTGETLITKGMRKQEATSVFVPIYLTNSKKIYKCSKCPAEFHTKEERGEHAGLHKKHFKCTDCSKRYFTPEALDTHRATETHVHTCDQCSKVFHSQVYLKRHRAVHVEERNYACDICNKAYTSIANCRAHKRSVHALVKKHVCDECGKAFARKDKLKRHQLIHIPYENRPVFPCPFRSHTGCKSTFYREDKLKRHLFTHSKEKPYKCEECDKGFARRDNLNDHMKTHTKDFSYICPTCDRGFLGPAKLKKHLRSVHPDNQYDVEAIGQKPPEVPTMASIKVDTTENTPTHRKVLETQITVGLDVVNEAISSSSGTQFEPPQPPQEAMHSDEDTEQSESSPSETNQVVEEQLITVSAPSLPPAPPLIHQPNLPSNTVHHVIPSGSVFIPRANMQPGIFNRDMVTIPNELLSMVHGLNT